MINLSSYFLPGIGQIKGMVFLNAFFKPISKWYCPRLGVCERGREGVRCDGFM